MQEEKILKIKSSIKNSHQRCEMMGIDVNLKYSKRILDNGELHERLNKKAELIFTAEPFINKLHDFVKGSNFFAILTDEEGCILSVVGDEDILCEAFSLKMIPGAYMDEESIGTNAMSIALSDKIPVQVSGKEHYIKAYHRWTCSAAPIKDVDGNIIGVLDLTGYSEEVHSHTLGMVVAAVNSIEKILEIKGYNEKLKVSKIYTDTIIESIPSGLLTTDLNGNIITHNIHCRNMFGFSEGEMNDKKIWELFEGWDKVKATIESKESFLDEDVFVNAKTNKLQFNLSVHPIWDNNKNLTNYICVFKEVKKEVKKDPSFCLPLFCNIYYLVY